MRWISQTMRCHADQHGFGSFSHLRHVNQLEQWIKLRCFCLTLHGFDLRRSLAFSRPLRHGDDQHFFETRFGKYCGKVHHQLAQHIRNAMKVWNLSPGDPGWNLVRSWNFNRAPSQMSHFFLPPKSHIFIGENTNCCKANPGKPAYPHAVGLIHLPRCEETSQTTTVNQGPPGKTPGL